jgi:site-specific DNA-methyltransferase (adenine-specific)
MNLEPYKEEFISLYNDDCLNILKTIPDKSINLILQDPPYNITACKWEWDIMTKINDFWNEWTRIISDNGAIVMTASQPFTSKLILSNLKMFRYELIWEKEKGTDFGNSNRKPLNSHENIIIFYKKQPIYNKQLLIGKPYTRKNNRKNNKEDLNFLSDNTGLWINKGFRTPKSVLKISRDNMSFNKNHHPTQKPVALMEFLIKTYSNENDLVFDGFMGSGTTGIACKNLKRNFIGVELDSKYFEIAKERIKG